ncbi:MAG: class I SAM-dependent methyltransferase, partial [Gammaproteobacteria bacterium]
MIKKLYLMLLKVFRNYLNVITGDTLVLDRLVWLRRHLPKTNNNESLLDVGCGSGAFTLEASLRGYDSVGLSWDSDNQAKAQERATALNIAGKCSFPIVDIRELNEFNPPNKFNYVVNFENIEHILDDKKLFKDIYNLLLPGGYLLLTSPNILYFPLSKEDLGPFETEENGGHVRRGYSKEMLKELCELSGFRVEKFDYCSGISSQFITRIYRKLISIFGLHLAWLIILPLRPIGFIFEILNLKGRSYSIC